MMAARDLNAGDLGRIDGGLPSIVTATLGGAVGRVLLVDVILAVFVCALAVHASAVRLVFAMARDGLLPYSGSLAAVSRNSKTPIVPVFVVGAVAMAILAVNVNLPKLIEVVTMVAALWANLAYLIVTATLLRRRLEGWPHRDVSAKGYFSLGRLAIPINAAAVVWSSFMVVNIAWPRAAVYGPEWQHRFAPVILTAILVLTALAAGLGFTHLERDVLPRCEVGVRFISCTVVLFWEQMRPGVGTVSHRGHCCRRRLTPT